MQSSRVLATLMALSVLMLGTQAARAQNTGDSGKISWERKILVDKQASSRTAVDKNAFTNSVQSTTPPSALGTIIAVPKY